MTPAEPGGTIEYSINGGSSWSGSFTAAMGTNSVLVRQVDAAGNLGVTTPFSFALVAHPTVTVLERSITSSLDDVEEGADGKIYTTSARLDLAYEATIGSQTVGLRFTNLGIPDNAIITNAYIQFQTYAISTGYSSLLISGEDTDDAAAFTTVRFNTSSRADTNASVAWTPPDWSLKSETGPGQRRTSPPCPAWFPIPRRPVRMSASRPAPSMLMQRMPHRTGSGR